jgi:hypothetical protein
MLTAETTARAVWDPEDAKSSNNIANSRANNRSIPGSNISRDASNSRYTVLAAVGTPRTEELQATFPVSRPQMLSFVTN